MKTITRRAITMAALLGSVATFITPVHAQDREVNVLLLNKTNILFCNYKHDMQLQGVMVHPKSLNNSEVIHLLNN